MKLTTLGAAAAAFAAYVYLKRQREEQPQRSPAAGSASQPGTGELDTGMPGTGAESPNIAERMSAAGVIGTPTDEKQGLASARSADEMFGSSSQQGSQPESTGLPDLTRGA